MDQHPLARGNAGVLEQHLPGGDRDHRHGGRPDVVERRGLRRDPRRLGQRVVGVGAGEAAVGDAIDLVAGRQAGDTGADRLDRAREVGAERERERLRQDALAGPDPGIPGADASGRDADQHLALAGRRTAAGARW